MTLHSVSRLVALAYPVAASTIFCLSLASCSREASKPTSNNVAQSASRVQIERSAQSDEAWTDHLIYIASEGIKSGSTRDALRRFEEINAAIDKVQLTEDGVDCTELVVLEREKISQKLVRFAQQSGVDINLIRFLPIDEKSGFVKAMIILVKEANGKPKAK